MARCSMPRQTRDFEVRSEVSELVYCPVDPDDLCDSVLDETSTTAVSEVTGSSPCRLGEGQRSSG